MADLEAQARELMRQGCHHTDATANRCRICLVVWARRLVAESRAGIRQDIKKVLEGFDAGVFVRDISRDHHHDWAIRVAPYLGALGRLAILAAEAEPGAQDRAGKGGHA